MLAPSDFLTHATWVTDPINNPNEMAFRSGVSRAYYSLFHEAKQMLKTKRGITIGSFSSYKKVKDELFKIDKHAYRQYKKFHIESSS